MFDCLSFLSSTQLPNQNSSLAQSTSKNLFIPPHFLKMLVEVSSYLLQIKKNQITEFCLDIVLSFMYQLSLVGNNSKQVQFLCGIKV